MQSAAFNEFKQFLQSRNYRDALALAQTQALNAPAGNGFWHAQQAVVFNRMKQFDKAREAAEKSLSIAPANPWTYGTLGDALSGEGNDSEAISAYENALAHAGNDARIGKRVAPRICERLLHAKKWGRLRAFIPAAPLREEDRLRFEAHAFRAEGRIDEALEACRRRLQHAPDNRDALWFMTEIEIEREGLEAVRARMGRLAKIPSRPPVYGEIYASLCRRAGVADEALKQYDKLQSRGGGKSAVRKKAFALAKSGKEREAIPILEELLRSDAHDYYVHKSYGAACARIGEIQRALSFYEELLSANPSEKALYGYSKALRKKVKPRNDETA
jgi:tetratricopeptide (TPR) repeat protein